MVCIFSRGVVRGVAGIYIYLAFWPYGVHIMDIWSSGHTDIWSSEHLVIQSSCHHSRLLAIRTFDHLAIWTSGHPDIWSSGLLATQTSGHLSQNVLIRRFSAYLEGYTNLKFLTSSLIFSSSTPQIYMLGTKKVHNKGAAEQPRTPVGSNPLIVILLEKCHL